MARTSTEFQMKEGMLESIHRYLTGQGFGLSELNGCPIWMKSGLLGGNYYYVQFCDMGDKFVLDEWLGMSSTTEEYPVDRFSRAAVGIFTCFKIHSDLIQYVKSL